MPASPFASAQLLQSLGQAVIATDLPGVVWYWNPEATRMYGWTADETVGNHAASLVMAEVPQELHEEIMECLVAGEKWSGGFTVQRKDGSTFPALVTTTGIHNDADELVGVVAVSSDLGGALQPVLAQSSDAAVMLNSAGRLTYVSPAADRLFGWTNDTVLGQPLWKLIHHDDRMAVADYAARVAASNEPQPALECRVRSPDGWCWADLLLTNVLHDPAVRGLVGNLRDVTERITDRQQRTELIEQLQVALTSRLEIEQAKGLLAGREGIDISDAFLRLRRHARDNNLTLHDVAHGVIAGSVRLPTVGA